MVYCCILLTYIIESETSWHIDMTRITKTRIHLAEQATENFTKFLCSRKACVNIFKYILVYIYTCVYIYIYI